MVRTKHIRAFGHEVHAAKNDVLGLLATGGPLRQLERISSDIGKLDDLITLIMMAKNDQAPAQLSASLANTRVGLIVIQPREAVGQNRLQHRTPYRSTRLLWR